MKFYINYIKQEGGNYESSKDNKKFIDPEKHIIWEFSNIVKKLNECNQILNGLKHNINEALPISNEEVNRKIYRIELSSSLLIKQHDIEEIYKIYFNKNWWRSITSDRIYYIIKNNQTRFPNSYKLINDLLETKRVEGRFPLIDPVINDDFVTSEEEVIQESIMPPPYNQYPNIDNIMTTQQVEELTSSSEPEIPESNLIPLVTKPQKSNSITSLMTNLQVGGDDSMDQLIQDMQDKYKIYLRMHRKGEEYGNYDGYSKLVGLIIQIKNKINDEKTITKKQMLKLIYNVRKDVLAGPKTKLKITDEQRFFNSDERTGYNNIIIAIKESIDLDTLGFDEDVKKALMLLFNMKIFTPQTEPTPKSTPVESTGDMFRSSITREELDMI